MRAVWIGKKVHSWNHADIKTCHTAFWWIEWVTITLAASLSSSFPRINRVCQWDYLHKSTLDGQKRVFHVGWVLIVLLETLPVCDSKKQPQKLCFSCMFQITLPDNNLMYSHGWDTDFHPQIMWWCVAYRSAVTINIFNNCFTLVSLCTSIRSLVE